MKHVSAQEGKSVVLVTAAKPETRTNAATLVGCYLVLERGWTPEQAWAPFEFDNAVMESLSSVSGVDL